jgi:hypothetical protein
MVTILIMVTILHMVASSDHGHFDNDLGAKNYTTKIRAA